MEEKKGEGHDQETQTTFDINNSSAVLTHPPSSIPPSVPIMERNQNNYSSVQPWGPRYSCQPPSYPENYYPYEAGYPTPPPPPPQHHYYMGRTPHWRHPEGGVVYQQNHSAPVHVGSFRSNEYQRRNFYPPNPNEGTPLRNAEIARPKAEWPRTYHPFPKPTIPAHFLAATMHGVHRNVQTELGGPPSTAASLRSTVLDVPGSSISSPRASAHLTRKRARSNTPSSIESIDLNMLIRNSPDSLLGHLAGSRISSAGSFGHLSPLGFCTSSACHRTQTSAVHPIRPPPFITPPPIQTLKAVRNQEQPRDVFPSSTTDTPKEESTAESMNCAESPPLTKPVEVPSSRMKEENVETCKLDSTTSPGVSEVPAASDNEADDGHGEGELNLTCRWKDCTITYDNQEALVKHVNCDHIKKEKREYTCYWQDCCREQKPFKAQYMLVVHMRRHTGEKPHVCKYEGCTKAYSRLENLKTHLRSHTGERPYVCEVEGCIKAFSNASDRAKHQNRTHSSVKPYVCKVPGCPKRYTDPSSLRKHTKTVHGDQGVKRHKLNSDGGKDTQNSSKKTSSGTHSNQSQSNNDITNTTVQSPSSDVKSPGSGSGSGVIKKGDGYSSSVASISCHTDMVSSSCDVGSPAVDIPGSHEASLGVAQVATSGLSPRSPPYINHLPDIVEGEWEPAPDGCAVTTVQQVASQRQSETVTLPKIHNRNKDIASWVIDVHRRMSQTSSRRSSESSHISEMNGDVSRRSSESGWASNNESRRSSQTSLNPPVAPHPPNAQVPSVPKLQHGSLPRNIKMLLTPHSDSEAALRRASETSNASSQSLAFNTLSRNSSGYGSQSNLAIIRSPMFHRIPYQLSKEPFQLRPNGANRPLRRLSDTVICEADSSEMSRQHDKEKEEYRRRSEPAQNMRWNSRPDTMIQLSSDQTTNEAEPRETELTNEDIDPKEFDAYLSPEQVQPQQTQRLRHFPYPSEDEYPQQLVPMESQTIHYRPNQPTARPPYHPPPNRMPLQRFSSQYPPNLYYQRQPRRLQSVPQGQMIVEYQQRVPEMADYYGEGTCMQSRPQEFPNLGSYEDMLNSMEALSTDGNSNETIPFGLGNGNMVVNDMNTLLNSLVEEDKYLDMQQNSHQMVNSALSSIF